MLKKIEHTDITERKTTPNMRTLLHTYPCRASKYHNIHNYYDSSCRSCFPECTYYVPTHTMKLVTCAHGPLSVRTVPIASLRMLLTIYQDYLNRSYLSTNILWIYEYYAKYSHDAYRINIINKITTIIHMQHYASNRS
jgi:hypothetical protein